MIAWMLVAVFFASTCMAIAFWQIEVERLRSYKRVGTWYEARVAELENETRVLAEQIVASGAIRHRAMPLPPVEPDRVYLSDDTGLVNEVLDAASYYAE